MGDENTQVPDAVPDVVIPPEATPPPDAAPAPPEGAPETSPDAAPGSVPPEGAPAVDPFEAEIAALGTGDDYYEQEFAPPPAAPDISVPRPSAGDELDEEEAPLTMRQYRQLQVEERQAAQRERQSDRAEDATVRRNDGMRREYTDQFARLDNFIEANNISREVVEAAGKNLNPYLRSLVQMQNGVLVRSQPRAATALVQDYMQQIRYQLAIRGTQTIRDHREVDGQNRVAAADLVSQPGGAGTPPGGGQSFQRTALENRRHKTRSFAETAPREQT